MITRPHILVCRETPGGTGHTYEVAGLPPGTGKDALRTLMRAMVAAGMTGSAIVSWPPGHPKVGRIRFHVRDIEAAARRALSETEQGFRLGRWVPVEDRGFNQAA